MGTRLDSPSGEETPGLAAVRRGVAWFTSREIRLPYEWLGLEMFYRRFGFREFASAGAEFGAAAAASGHPVFRLFVRLTRTDVTATAGEFRGLLSPHDRLTLPALYCDQLPFPVYHAKLMRDAVDSGGYALTHAALALMWMKDHEVPSPLGPAFERETVERCLALLPMDLPMDLQIEAAVFSAYLGYGREIPPAFLRRVQEGQRENGSWGRNPDSAAASWHTSGLGVWLFAELEPSIPKLDTMVPRRGRVGLVT
jgi:hypothetical protein